MDDSTEKEKKQSRSAKYGRPVWVSHYTYESIQKIKKKSKRDGTIVTPAMIIDDLLSLRNVPKYLIHRMKTTVNPEIRAVYQDILKFIIERRKKGKNYD